MPLWSGKRGRRRQAANPVAAGCRFGSPPPTPSPPSQRASGECTFCLTFLCTAFLRSKALCFLPGLSLLQTPIPLPLSCPAYAPHRSLVMERYLWNHQVGLTRNAWKSPRYLWSSKSQPVRSLGLWPAASEGRKPEKWSLASWEVRGWKANQPWCISSSQGKRCYLLMCSLPGTRLLLPSFRSDSQSHSSITRPAHILY